MAVLTGNIPNAPTGPTTPIAGYRLIFADDFIGTSLDPNFWTPTREFPGAGSPGIGFNNYEKEAFTATNVTLNNSICTLTAKAQTVTVLSPPSGFASTYNYTSGIISTANAAQPFIFSPQHAGTIYLQAKIKIPGGATASASSTFPAFWSDSVRVYGASANSAFWSREMDFFEFHAPTALDSVNLYPAGGYGTNTGNLTNSGAYYTATVADMSAAFHLYTVQINSDGSFQLWIDGVAPFGPLPAHTAIDWMCLIIDYALDETPASGWNGDTMQIDYVAGWQDAGVSIGSGILGGGVAAGTVAG